MGADYTDLGAGAGDFLGMIVGEIISAPDRETAERLRQQAMAQYNIDLPPVREMQAQAIQSQAAGAQGSQEAKASRLAALRMLQQRAQEGYTAEDRAAIADALGETQAAERGSREAIMRRVNPNSGKGLGALLSNQQAAASRANRQGLDIAAGSRRQALQALSQQGQLAGGIDETEFGQAFQRGQAQDAISKFNEANRMDAGRFNAQQHQQRFDNQTGLADRRAGQYGAQATEAEKRAERKARLARGVGAGVGSVAGKLAGAI
jgi:hypothetical protein